MEQFTNVPSYKLVALSKQNDTVVQPSQKRNYVPVLLSVIVVLFVINTGLLTYILFFSERLGIDTAQVNASLAAPVADNRSQIDTKVQSLEKAPSDEMTAMMQETVTTGELPQGFNQETVREMVEKSPYSSIFSKSLDQAEDAKKRADLNSIGTVMNIYMMEQDGQFPDNFPESLTCIGTDTKCYDLFSLLVPVYLDKPIMDMNGTIGNTRYLIGKSTDGISTVVLQATSEDGTVIEVRK